MSEKMVDVTLHIDEDTSHDEREALRDKLLQKQGVMAADCHDDKPHLMIVEYDPEFIKSSDFVNVAKEQGLHAELIGL